VSIRILRFTGAFGLLLVLLVAGARRIGPAPALGGFLDPAHGVWSLARTANHPAHASGSIPGLGAAVRIEYDDRAVPHIFASTEEDAYRALGYVVARDRLFQMYAQTLAASGRLTELAGRRALELDREMRGLGIPRAARHSMLAQDTAGFSSVAKAYADGVNAYIRGMSASEIPLEFRLTGAKIPEWTPFDSYLLIGRMGWTLAYISTENDRAAAASIVGRAAAEDLFPDNVPIQEPIQPNGQSAPRFDFHPLTPPGKPDSAAQMLLAAANAFVPSRMFAGDLNSDDAPRNMASNNWAVAPAKSADHHALLEGDPHLDLTLPSIWYEVHLVVPGKLDVYGVTIPGAPAVVIGLNRDIAWTFTNTGADVMDYYAEKVDDEAHPSRYELDGVWRSPEREIERYAGPDGKAVAVDTLYFTHRGPMRRIGSHWISMRWTPLESQRELGALLEASHARTAAELQEGMARSFFAPAQNMLAADRAGHIAIRSTGHFPIRPGNGKGDAVRDGTTSTSDWSGFLPLERYPQSVDPSQGYLASANQQPIDPKETKDWWGGSYDPWRALRINALLRAHSAITPDLMRQFETDAGSERANLFVPWFLSAAERRPSAGATEAAAFLKGWDHRYTLDNTGAVLFEEAMRELTNRTWDELSVNGGHRVATPSSAVLLELLADSASIWWDDHSTQQIEHRDDIVSASLAAAFANLETRLGAPSSPKWRWDNVRFTNIAHLLRLAPLGALNIPVQGGPGLLNPSTGNGGHGSSWRMVVDLGPELRAWATYPGGQSGNPFSAHYRDRIALWQNGKLEPLRIPRDIQALGDTARAELILERTRP
jgi:penicillin amidase